MSKAIVYISLCLAFFLLLGIDLGRAAYAQTPVAPGSIQVSRIQYDGNTGTYVNNFYVSPYSFPEIFNDPAGLNTGNEIQDVEGIQGSIYIDQFNSVPASSAENTLSLPSNGEPAAYPTVEPGSYITTSFSSKSEGALMLGLDGQSLTYMGYQGGDQLDDVSNSYSPNPNYQLFPNSYTVDPNLGTPISITAASDTSKGNATITLSSPVTLPAGSYFTIAGMNTSGYNGTFATSAAVSNSTTLTFSGLPDSLASCSSTGTPCGGTATYDPPYPFYDREVALINSTGLVSLTPIDNANSGDNPRAAITVDENEFYTVGNSDSTTASPSSGPNNPGLTIGARCAAPLNNFSYQFGTYFAADRPDESAKKHVKDNNWRGVGIYPDGNGNQQLYVSKGSGGNGDDGLFQVGTSLPACSSSLINANGVNYNAGITITELPGLAFPVTNQQTGAATPILPFGFWFANPTTLYVADEGNPPSYTGGQSPSFSNATNGTYVPSNDPYAGLEKWSLVNGTWVLDYTIQAGLNFNQPQTFAGYNDINGDPIQSYTYGLRNMTGHVNGDGTVTIYAVTAQFSAVSSGEPDPTSIVGITDSLAATTLPANEQFVTLQTAQSGELYRGVAYIPPAPGTQRLTQTITFPNPGPVSYGVAPITLTATATSGWPIAYTLISGPATLAGNLLTITGAGTVVVEADQSGNTDYSAAASVQDSIVVNPETTTVNWAIPAPITYGTPLSGTQLNATASAAGNSIAGTFTYTPAAGAVLTAGIQTLSVSFTPNNSNYASSTGSVTLQVNQATPTITWANPAAITYGTPLSGTQLNATASVAGSFAYTPAAGTVLNAGSQTLSVLFTPTDSTDYTTATDSVSLTVNQASQTISFTTNAPAQAVYGTSFTVAASATSGLAITYSSAGSCTNSGATYTMTSGTGTCTVTASQPGNSNYLAASPVSESTAAAQANQSVSFTVNAPAQAVYGTSFTVAASATSGLAVTYTSAGSCTNSGATYTMTSGVGTCTVTASQPGNSNYLAASPVSETTNAVRANPTVSFTGAPASAPVGSQFTLIATTNASGSAVITVTGTVCSLSGEYSPDTATVLKDSGNCKFTASWGADQNYNPATATQVTTATKITPIITWPTPASIVYGTPLSATQLDATANTAGTFTYKPAAGTVLNAGSNTLTVKFVPTGMDYLNASATTTLEVTQAPSSTKITSATRQVVYLNKKGIATAVIDVDVVSYQPEGIVYVTASTGETCSGSVSPETGGAGCKLEFASTGTRTVNASYSGDANHLPSNSSNQVTVVVEPY